MEALALAALVGIGLKVAYDRQQEEAAAAVEATSAARAPQANQNTYGARDPGETWSRYMQTARGIPTTDAGLDPRLFLKKEEQENQAVIAPNTRNLDTTQLYDRRSVYTSTLKTNEPAQPRQLVGPGLGIGPDATASDGFHNMYRPPQYLNDHRLTQLPGSQGGPARAEVSNRGVLEPGTRIDDRSKPVDQRIPGPAAAQGLSLRGEQTATAVATNRQQTGYVQDSLQFTPAARLTQTLERLPGQATLMGNQSSQATRPGHGFANGPGGYLQDTSLARALGDNRNNETHSITPGGRMNVGMNPVLATGDQTKMRSDGVMDVGNKTGDASRFQQGRVPRVQEDRRLAATESQRNTFGSMAVTVQQLETNPYNIPIFKEY